MRSSARTQSRRADHKTLKIRQWKQNSDVMEGSPCPSAHPRLKHRLVCAVAFLLWRRCVGPDDPHPLILSRVYGIFKIKKSNQTDQLYPLHLTLSFTVLETASSLWPSSQISFPRDSFQINYDNGTKKQCLLLWRPLTFKRNNFQFKKN